MVCKFLRKKKARLTPPGMCSESVCGSHLAVVEVHMVVLFGHMAVADTAVAKQQDIVGHRKAADIQHDLGTSQKEKQTSDLNTPENFRMRSAPIAQGLG